MITYLYPIVADTCSNWLSGGFFGLVPWYYYLPHPGCQVSFDPLSVSSGIPAVLLAVVDDLLRIAGLVAVGFVIYGAIQYLTSQGDPGQTSKAQSTIISALIGLAIALVAVVFVSYLGNHLK